MNAGERCGMRPERVVVIGGGISGLVAALRFTQAGSDVTVIEPGPLGGKLQTSVVAGRLVDETADAFLLRVPWALALCHDLEIVGELISPAERTAHVFLDGRRHPLPAAHVLGVPTDLDALARSGLVSPGGLARAAADLTLGPQPTDPLAATGPHLGSGSDRHADGPGRTGPGRTPPDRRGRGGQGGSDDRADDVATGPYLRGRLGDEVVDHLVDPLVGGINAGDTASLSLAAVVPQLDAAARSGDPSLIRSCAAQRERAIAAAHGTDAPIFAAPIDGMARLVDGLLGFLPGVDLRTGHRAVSVEPVGGAGARTVRVVLDDDATLEVDAVVVATPAHVAAHQLQQVCGEAADLLAAVAHASVSMLTFAFDGVDIGDVSGASGCLLPRDQGTLATAISYATSKWAQLRDPDRNDAILRVSAGRAGDDRHLDLDDDGLTRVVLRDLDRVIGVTGPPTEVRIGRWPSSFPQYAPGHLNRIDALEAALADTSVRVVGMALRGVGIPACIRSAEEAAASLGATWPTRSSLA